jgi:hypothetical protein
MEQNQQANFSNSMEDNDRLNIKELLSMYLLHWKWIVLSIAAALFISFVYLRYTIPTYDAQAVILIQDEKKGGGISNELSAFEDFGLISGGSTIDNEIQILKSRSLISRTVKDLKLNLSFYNNEGLINKGETWKNTPISITFLEGDTTIYAKNGEFELSMNNNNTFLLVDKQNNISRFFLFVHFAGPRPHPSACPQFRFTSRVLRLVVAGQFSGSAGNEVLDSHTATSAHSTQNSAGQSS